MPDFIRLSLRERVNRDDRFHLRGYLLHTMTIKYRQEQPILLSEKKTEPAVFLGNVLEFQVCTDQVVNRAEFGLPCDGTHSAEGTPGDFTEMRTIRQAMESDQTGYFDRLPKRFDEFYVLPQDQKAPVAVLQDEQTGRKVNVYTDMESLIIFN